MLHVPTYVCLVLLATLPFLNFVHLPVLDSFIENGLSMLLVALALPPVLLASIGRPSGGRLAAWLSLLFIGLLFIALVSGRAWLPSLKLFSLFALGLVAAAWLVCQLACEIGISRYFKVLAWSMVVGGALQSVGAVGVHYWLLADTLGYWMGMPGDRMSGLIAQSNLLGVYLFCSFMALLYLRISNACSRDFAWLVGVLFGFVFAGAASRGALVASFLLFAGLFFFKQQRRVLSIVLFECGIAVSLGVLLFILIDPLLTSTLTEMGYIPLGRDAVASLSRDLGGAGLAYRLAEWQKAWLMLMQYPLMGVGFGRYGIESFWMTVQYPWAEVSNSFPMHSHNLFAQIGAEFGCLGLLMLLMFLVALVRCLRGEDRGGELFFVYGVVIIFTVNSMLEYVLWNFEFAVLLVLFLAPLLGRYSVGGLARTISCILSLAWVTATLVLSLSAWSLYSVAIRTHSGMDENVALELRQATQDSLFGDEMQVLQLYSLPLNEGDLASEDALTEHLMAWRPYNLVLFRRMHVLALRGDKVGAMELARIFVRVYPADAWQLRDFFVYKAGANYSPAIAELAGYFVEVVK